MGYTQEHNSQSRRNSSQKVLSGALASLTMFILMFISACSGTSSANGTGQMTITAMTPGTVYTTGGQVVFTGTNFTSSTVATFGGVAAQKMYFQSSTLITAITPVVLAAATVDVVVTTPDKGSVTMAQADRKSVV